LRASIRGHPTITDGEKVERMKWINEILHRATAKVYVLRLKTHAWTEEDFGSLIEYAEAHEGIKGEVFSAANRS
jgi:hypothetical protein